MRVVGAGLVSCLILVVFAAWPLRAAKGEEQETPARALMDLPDFYQMTGKSEVAALAAVKEIGRFARFVVEEVYTQNYESPELRLMYRGMSWERRLDGEGGIRFEPGERYLLFLRYYREHEAVVRPDLFELVDGEWGRVKLEGEGESVHVEAMRLLMGAATRPDVRQQHAVLVGLLGSENHLAAAAAMSQAYERRLGSLDTIPVLLGQMERGIAGLQLGALRILRRLGPTLPDSLNRRSLAEAIHRRVDAGAPVPVRLEAVGALSALGKEAVPLLRKLSRTDPDQGVRYEAAVAIVNLEG